MEEDKKINEETQISADDNTEEETESPEPIEEGEFKIAEEPRFYEIYYAAKTGLEEPAVAEISNAIRSAIIDLGGLVVEESHPKPQKLAYEIKRHSDALSGWIKFLLKHDELKEFNKKVNKITEILRFRIFKAEKAEKMRATRPQKHAQTAKEGMVKDEEIDKKLEEILG